MNLDAIPLRLLGCLIEKQMTTPDYYPMTINALTAAANQKTNRDPVTAYSEADILDGINRLRDEGLVRAVRSPGGRAAKYKHALDDILEIDGEQASVLAVLMLRGEQTSGELRLRTERYHEFASVEEVEQVLVGLQTREDPLAVRLERRPGEKEARYRHLLGGVEQDTAPVPAEQKRQPQITAENVVADLEARLAELEERVAALEDR